VGFEWDEANKAGINYRKHGVRMPEAIPVFDDPYAITITDEESDPNEQRFVTLGWARWADCSWSCTRGEATVFASYPHVRPKPTRGSRTMKDRYDFSKGKRGRVDAPEPEPEGKVRITIRLDQDIVDRFFQMAEASGGATGYQTLINAALREYLDGKAPKFENALRRIIREELKSSAA
jgi:uncharacterized protein (DUF4415 family)